MDRSSPGKYRRFGLLMPAAAAVVLILYLFLPTGQEEPDTPEEAASQQSGNSGPNPELAQPEPPQESGPQFVEGDGAKTPESVPVSKASPPPEPAAARVAARSSRAPERLGTLTVWGTVSDRHGRPVSGAHLRWLPALPDDLEPVNHDPSVLGPEGDNARTAFEDLDRMLDLSRSARSRGDGRYRLELPNQKPYGTVAAWAPGTQIELKPVHPLPRQAADPEAGQDAQIDFRLRRAGQIRGRVTDRESGRPASGMVVKALMLDSPSSVFMAMSDKRGANAVVREDGAYTIAGLAAGAYQVIVETGSSNYGPVPLSNARRVALEEGQAVDEVDFEVELGGRLRALILGPEGEPLPDVPCQVISKTLLDAVSGAGMILAGDPSVMDQLWLTDSKRRQSDSEGLCDFRGLPLGQSYAVGASSSRHPPSISEPVLLDRQQPEAEIEIRLERGGTLAGLAVFENGRPAPGVRIRLRPRQPFLMGSFPTRDTSRPTDGEGRFRFPNLPEGTYELSADANREEGADPPEMIELAANQVIEGIRLVVPTGEATLVGTVSDAQGRPLLNAFLDVMSRSGSRSARSQADGSFRVEGVAPGVIHISASHPSYANLYQQLEGVQAGETRVELILERMGWIAGRVVGPDGEPVRSGGRVSLLAVPSGENRWGGSSEGTARTVGEEGKFQMEASPGSYQVQADMPGYALAQSEPVTVKPAEQAPEVVIQVGQGAVLSGIVVLSEAGPVEGAVIRLNKVENDTETYYLSTFMDAAAPRSGEDGRFRIPSQAPGEYHVSASHDEYVDSEPLDVVLEEGRTADVTLTLSRGGGISGRLVDGERPKGNIRVDLAGLGFHRFVVTGEDGAFRMSGVPAGLYVMMAGLPAGAVPDQADWDIRLLPVTIPRQEVVEAVLDYSLGIRLYGEVRNLPAEFAGTQVTLRRPGGPAPEDLNYPDPQGQFQSLLHTAGMSYIGRDGSYQIRGIPPGRYILEIPRPIGFGADGKPPQNLEDRLPLYRTGIVISDTDRRHPIVIP